VAVATEAVPNELPQNQRAQLALSSCMLITKTVALTSAQKTAMISIPSHVSEWFKLRSLCLAWRREGSLPRYYTAWLRVIRL
jgi:hypothetical protein